MNKGYTILVGDVLEQLATLPDNSVHCCVTSPPYWGLRDYGTGRWEGGDPACTHTPTGASVDPKNPLSTARNGKPSAKDAAILAGRCPCGAVKVDRQIGLEATPEEFIAKMVAVFRAVRRVLREDGTLWLNIGDCYNGIGGPGKQNGGPIGPTAATAIENTRGRKVVGIKTKDLLLMPWRVALALQEDGWWVRSAICWAKKSPMPESVSDRPTSSWEPIFLMSKSATYFYDSDAVREVATREPHAGQHKNGELRATGPNDRGGNSQWEQPDRVWAVSGTRNQRNVWHLGPEPYAEAHFATFPTEIPRRAIMAGTSERGCCPTCGSPWQRVTSREKVRRERPNDYTKRNGEDGTGNSCANSVAGVEVRTLGWEQTCKCPPHLPVPCVVLDPFSGSGTTGAVARQLGRNYVGCELNPEYVELSRVRIGKAERPHSHRTDKAEAGGLFA